MSRFGTTVSSNGIDFRPVCLNHYTRRVYIKGDFRLGVTLPLHAQHALAPSSHSEPEDRQQRRDVAGPHGKAGAS